VRKFLFTAGAAVSLILLIGVVTFWGWSRSHTGYARLHGGQRFVALYPAPTGLTVTTWIDSKSLTHPTGGKLNTFDSWPTEAGTYAYMVNRNGLRWEHLGIQWSVLKHLENGRSLILPEGMLMALFAIAPLIWLRRWNMLRKADRYPSMVGAASAT
jgi:hypothetical protein